MGWKGTHLFEFCLWAARHGSWELSAESTNALLDGLQLRKCCPRSAAPLTQCKRHGHDDAVPGTLVGRTGLLPAVSFGPPLGSLNELDLFSRADHPGPIDLLSLEEVLKLLGPQAKKVAAGFRTGYFLARGREPVRNRSNRDTQGLSP